MNKNVLKDISLRMKRLDMAMLTTQTGKGLLTDSPLRHNDQAEFDGHSFYFTFGKSAVVRDIEANPKVNVAFMGEDDSCISVTGKAKVVRDKSAMLKYWSKDLDDYFIEGIDTPDIVMIHVVGSEFQYV